jgi:hypothetical protein
VSELWSIIASDDPAVRNRSLDAFCRAANAQVLLDECAALDRHRRSSGNLYHRVRALFFLYAIHRFHLPYKPGVASRALVSFQGFENLLKRRYEEAIGVFLAQQCAGGASEPVSSALAAAYRGLAFQTLADQVRRSVRSVRGNQWMFRTGHPSDYALRIHPGLLQRNGLDGAFPILHETTPVRMDLTHSGWSDIFFLGMDYPEGARVLNVSIDLAVRGSASPVPKPPVEAFFRVIDRPILRLVSVDLESTAEIEDLGVLFDFGRDYLGLLKAAVIASGIVPPGMEGSGQPLSRLLTQLIGQPGYGIEIVSHVNDIPKGSRLAVSTNLLACLIAACMRATRQARSLTGQLFEAERRLVAARAILGEWLGGSGGGWQDSGGVWPGIKLIQGVQSAVGDIEYGVSRGRLLPNHRILEHGDVTAATREKLQQSLVLVHGGMAQDVGPILEMVTEKYLLRSEAEWIGRQEACAILDQIVGLLQSGDVPGIGKATGRNFEGPIQTIIPWSSNLYTETLISRVRGEFGSDFWGFWMLGGMSGGGMGFIFAPERKAEAQDRLQAIMRETKRRLEGGVPFAMEPVVYDFAINERGTHAELAPMLPAGYYNLVLPAVLRKETRALSISERSDLREFGALCRASDGAARIQNFFERMLPRDDHEGRRADSLESLLERLGFDPVQHERIQSDLRAGRIGLAQNRLPVSTRIEDVELDAAPPSERHRQTGADALALGSVAVVSLAGGAGTRWTHGAGVVKALNPFCKFSGRHRSFVEVHLAKSRRTARTYGAPVPHVFTTSFMTHEPVESYLREVANYGYEGPLHLSPGRTVGLRLVPMTRDLHFAWEEMPQQMLDAQAQKMRDSSRAALIGWARQMGEGSNYTANLPLQCLHPVGHWYEIPNMFRNGVLASLLSSRPQLRYLMVHNIDTMGADLDPAILGRHIESGPAMTVEVITRKIDDRGGGLARVDGHVRLIEGMALPREEKEFELSYYNSNTFWIDIDALLQVFGLTRTDLADAAKVRTAVRAMAARMPAYITLKDVKKRWGKGQEDIYPVTQFEKLWVDMTALPEMDCHFIVAPRARGQQLKDVAQLDGWLRDGSAAYVESLCDF